MLYLHGCFFQGGSWQIDQTKPKTAKCFAGMTTEGSRGNRRESALLALRVVHRSAPEGKSIERLYEHQAEGIKHVAEGTVSLISRAP